MDEKLIRIVLNDGSRRDFDISGVFTQSDKRKLVNDVLTFVKLHGENKGIMLHSWYPVKEGEITDGIPNGKTIRY